MPIHIAITRRVRLGCEAEFQQALREFFQASFAHGGVLGATMIMPPPGSDSAERKTVVQGPCLPSNFPPAVMSWIRRE